VQGATGPTGATPTVGGSDTQVLFNDAGAIGGDAGFTYNKTTDAGSIGALALSAGNLSFTTTGQRITGDFSNATPVNRPMFQSSTTNGYTVVRAIPNGTSQYAEIGLGNNSDATSATSTFFMSLSATEARIASSQANTGTLLPLTFQVGGNERFRIDTSGQLGIGGANYGSSGQVLTSNGSGAAPSWQSAGGGAPDYITQSYGIV
jgi:hypothetical protein